MLVSFHDQLITLPGSSSTARRNEHKKSPNSPCILLRWIFGPGSGSLEQVPARGGLEAVVDGAGGRGPEADVDH